MTQTHTTIINDPSHGHRKVRLTMTVPDFPVPPADSDETAPRAGIIRRRCVAEGCNAPVWHLAHVRCDGCISKGRARK